MNERRYPGRRGLCALMTIAVLLVTAVVPILAGQSQSRAEPASTAARTPWGDPDLQGIWNNFTITPLERPDSRAGQAFLSAEEAAALEQQAAARVDSQNAPSDIRTEPLPVGGDVGAYNSFWTEQGTRGVSTRRTSLIIDPPDGRLPNFTAEGYARITSPENRRLTDVRDGRIPADGPEEMGLSERCLWYRGIPSLPTGYNNNYQIFQAPGWVVMLQEHIHDVRVIPLDGRPHLPPAIRQYAGDSRGHWEGDTLVVETQSLKGAFIRRWNRPENSLARGDLSDVVRVVERFTRVSPDTLDYEFTVDDPGTWERPWSGSLPMARTSGPIYEFACHEGNHGLMNIMSGSRSEERAAEAASGGSAARE